VDWASHANGLAMIGFKKIFVLLQLNKSDQAVLQMVSRIASIAKPAEIQFSHFSSNTHFAPTLETSHPWLFAAKDQDIREEMEQLILEGNVAPEGVKCSFFTEAANPVIGSLSKILEDDFDLVILSSDDPATATRLARKATCTLCVVPPNAPTTLGKPVVAVDFSEYSRLACGIGFDLMPEVPLALLHVAPIPPMDAWPKLSQESFIEVSEAYLKTQMESFSIGFGRSKNEFTTHLRHHESTTQGILDFVEEQSCDIMLAGSRGQDAKCDLLLGGKIESIIARSPIPVFITKAKGTGRSFAESILGINH
jgi:nucleotide-binding universal stress UspA family protein